LNRAFLFFLIILFVSLSAPNSSVAQNFLFKEPRDGKFKIKQEDYLDFTNAQHFALTGMLSVGFHKVLRERDIRHPKLMAAALATGVGLMKEYEDGYREGVGLLDILFNEIGILTFLYLSDVTHYTVTFKQVIMGQDDYGAGIRFFRTSEFSPLNASIGTYTIFDNRQRTWGGMDVHFSVMERVELHLGASLVNFAEPNDLDFHPNFGFALRLF